MKNRSTHRGEKQRSPDTRMEPRAKDEEQSTSPGKSAGNGRNAELAPVVITSGWIVLMRAVWMFLGPMALLLICLWIAHSSTGWLTALDAAYFAIIALMIGCRWAEQKSGKATTATGEPATWSNFNRYVVALVPLAVVAWIVLNVIGNHIYPRL